MSRILLSLSLATVLCGCGVSGKQKFPSSAKDYALADAMHYDHAIIDALRETVPGNINRLKPTSDEGINNTTLGDALQFEYEVNVDNAEHYEQLRTSLKNQGYLLFKSEENFGTTPDKFAVLKSKNQFDIVKFRATTGANYNISNDSIMLKLHEWYEQQPFEITGADADWVEVHLLKLTSPAALSFANEVSAFCPDLTEQGTETVENLAAEMLQTRRLFLWWD
ncbi:DUF4253 domain-containing protein [Chitinophaga sp. CF418]|uniref:DUF4253 domain-containing protein n=1 Tax=Chitinophaga sp. CF418 TaxID=1855287 RepID=UPI0009149D26|nr:DUF4253 domain-containing protein [Chitinophaga sp. CF418]SHM21731.1 protein of unknown function [Chitinophaga sp. CF418]